MGEQEREGTHAWKNGKSEGLDAGMSKTLVLLLEHGWGWWEMSLDDC